MIQLNGRITHVKLFGRVLLGIPSSTSTKLVPTTVTPTGEEFTVMSGAGYGFSQVTVKGDENLTAENIRNGVVIYGVTGRHVCDVADLDPITVTPTGKKFTRYPTGDGFSQVTVTGDDNLVPENIVEGVTIYGVTGSNELISNLLDAINGEVI